MSADEAKTSDKRMRGVGVIEAPRGTFDSMIMKQMEQE